MTGRILPPNEGKQIVFKPALQLRSALARRKQGEALLQLTDADNAEMEPSSRMTFHPANDCQGW